MRTRTRQAFNWMTMTLSALSFEAGDWDAARASVGPPLGSLVGVSLIFRLLRDAELALGEGDESLARERLRAAEPLVRVTGEAQWHGQFGSLMGELSRRGGELEQAQEAVARALDELEVCTDDVMRIARVTAVGAAVEADRALRARDLREPETESDALARTRIHLDRLAAAAEDGGPVERAWLAVGTAEQARAQRSRRPDALAGGSRAVGRARTPILRRVGTLASGGGVGRFGTAPGRRGCGGTGARGCASALARAG